MTLFKVKIPFGGLRRLEKLQDLYSKSVLEIENQPHVLSHFSRSKYPSEAFGGLRNYKIYTQSQFSRSIIIPTAVLPTAVPLSIFEKFCEFTRYQF